MQTLGLPLEWLTVLPGGGGGCTHILGILTQIYAASRTWV